MSLLRCGDTLAIDLLHAPSKADSVLITSKYWDKLYKIRYKFYTKNFKAFLGYAKNQAYMYGQKGDKFKVLEQILEVFRNNSGQPRISSFWHKLPVTRHSNFTGKDTNGIEQYSFCGKSFQKTVSYDYALDILISLHSRYGSRTKLASDSNGADWKALSHALRACYEVKSITQQGDLKFPLDASQFLLEVKMGLYDYKYITNLLEDMVEEIDNDLEVSTLPLSIDQRFINDNTLEILRGVYNL
jgi:hypothetical protein